MPWSNFPREKILPRQIGMIYNLLSVTKTNYKQKTLILKNKLSFSFCVQCKKNYMKTPEVGNLGKRHVFGFASSDTTLRLSEFAPPSSSSPLFGPQSGGAMVFALHGGLAQKWRTVYVQYKKCYVHDFSCPMFLVLVQSEFASHLFRITIHAPVFLHPGLLYSLGHAPMMQWRGRGGKKSGANAQLRWIHRHDAVFCCCFFMHC